VTKNFGDGAVCDASGSYQDMALAISVKNKKYTGFIAPQRLKAVI